MGVYLKYKKISKRNDKNLLHWKLIKFCMHFNVLFNEYCWRSCPVCVKSLRLSSPEGHWYLCFIQERRDLHFTVHLERQIFEKLFLAFQSFCQKSAETEPPEKYCFHIFVLMSDMGYKNFFLFLRRDFFLFYNFSLL